ncbi:MAG: ATP-binding protein [Verrucomicrobiota bacterium]
MSDQHEASQFRFRLLNPAHYLDSLLFWSVYISSTMAILWLLASTAKNQIREIMIDQLVALEAQTSEMVHYYRQQGGLESDTARLQQALHTVSLADANILAMAMVEKDPADNIKEVGKYPEINHPDIDFTSPEHQAYLKNTLTEKRVTISEWELFTSGSATLLTPASSPIEYLYTSLPDENGRQGKYFLIIAFDAPMVQSSFYQVEEFAITAICLAILLATIIAILVRYRSVQRLQATEEKLVALKSLRKRDVLLSLVVGAADELLGQKDVESVFLELLVKLKSELNLYGLAAVVETGQDQQKYSWINQQSIESVPIGFGNQGGLLPEWKEALKSGDLVIIRRREGPVLLRAWMAEQSVEVMALVGMHREDHLNGVIVALEKKEKNTQDPGLVDTLKLTADIFSAAYQQRLQESRLLESSKMEALGRVAGGVAHEFNNLLHIITGNLRGHSRQEAVTTTDSERGERILEAAGRGTRIVEQLLRATRLNVPDLSPGNLNTLIEKTVSLASLAVGGGIQIRSELDSELPSVMLDEAQIQQVILNLLLNARDAVGQKGVIQIKTSHDGLYVMCDVIDDGGGIPDEVMDRLFEPFFTTKEPGKGTGLGLSTSRGILEQHHGTIEANNLPSGQCRFRFRLPVTDRKLVNADSPELAGSEALSPTGEVLIADDEKMCREVLKACLMEKNIEVREFDGGQPLVDYIRNTDAEISWVITDWTMPGLHGEELIRELRRQHREMKVFVTSGFVLETDKIPRVDGLINKPFGPEELFQVLANSVVRERR